MIRYRYNAAQVLYKILNEDIDVSSTDDSDEEPDFVESDIDELDSAGAVNVCVDVDNGVEHESDDNVSDVDDALSVENV